MLSSRRRHYCRIRHQPFSPLFMLYSSPKYNQQQPIITDFKNRDGDDDETVRSEQNKMKGGRRRRKVVGGVADVVADVREKSRSSTSC